jgi:hypothetical protein
VRVPDLVVAQRTETVVAAVGDRERVIAGVDCGFGTFAGWEWVTEDVVWAKLATLRRSGNRLETAVEQEGGVGQQFLTFEKTRRTVKADVDMDQVELRAASSLQCSAAIALRLEYPRLWLWEAAIGGVHGGQT